MSCFFKGFFKGLTWVGPGVLEAGFRPGRFLPPFSLRVKVSLGNRACQQQVNAVRARAGKNKTFFFVLTGVARACSVFDACSAHATREQHQEFVRASASRGHVHAVGRISGAA